MINSILSVFSSDPRNDFGRLIVIFCFAIYIIAAIIIYWFTAWIFRKKTESQNTEDPESPIIDNEKGIRSAIKIMLIFVIISVGYIIFFGNKI